MAFGGAPNSSDALKRHTDVYIYIYMIIVSDPAFMQIHVMLLSDRNAASPRTKKNTQKVNTGVIKLITPPLSVENHQFLIFC